RLAARPADVTLGEADAGLVRTDLARVDGDDRPDPGRRERPGEHGSDPAEPLDADAAPGASGDLRRAVCVREQERADLEVVPETRGDGIPVDAPAVLDRGSEDPCPGERVEELLR